jgi:hypothetical protein
MSSSRVLFVHFFISLIGRKSLSTQYSDTKITTSISKSYTNNKRDELMKVINEAKQKLENVSMISY